MHWLASAREVLLRSGAEFRDAAFRAEVVSGAFVFDVARGAVRVHHHPADGIEDAISHASLQLCGRRELRLDVDRDGGHPVERALDRRPDDAKAIT